MKKLINSALALIFAVALSSSVFAQPAKGMMNNQGNNFQPMMMQKALNLSDKQLEEIAKIRTEAQLKVVDLRANIQKYRLKIKEEMLKDNPSEKVVQNYASKINELQGKIKNINIDKRFKIFNLLDDNQKKIAKKKMLNFGNAMRGKMRGKMMKRMKRGNGAPWMK